MKIYIGCSGYNYKHWKELFYPEKLPAGKWLEYYASHFNSVEINNTFYAFPKQETLKKWVDQTPHDFVFTIKANRFLTHMKKLSIDDAFIKSLDEFQVNLKVMENKLGCLLWQLPPGLHINEDKLNALGKHINPEFDHVMEFRHVSWFDEAVYRTMRLNHLTFCMLSAPKLPDEMVVTGHTAYLRLHGKSKWYDYLYADDELRDWKNRLNTLQDVEKLYIYFNNDTHGHAVKNAQALQKLFDEPS